MAKYTGPVCKLCRREGEKLFLKGERCFTSKCAFDRRAFAPGQHGRTHQGRSDRESDYARQLRAKQKTRRLYNVYERQFRRYYGLAQRRQGMTGFNLLQVLESRLDNVVFRMGYAVSRAEARQLVVHGHFHVNGLRADVPSMLLKPGDVLTVHESARKNAYFKELPEVAEPRTVPAWIERDVKSLTGKVLRLPERAEIDGNIAEQLIVEYYSR
ncbi:MAG TPA: 30S ribosomal protein S4 [Anaerolineaceae bacterium]|nr:30S ribosomal protein S4 [Anaerolineaceae bacterium]HPN53691.1 30S ribosomal protein S4 [Anaerolineaceae bacterium]